MGYPDQATERTPNSTPGTCEAVAGLARTWMQVVAGASFVPGSRAQARMRLEGFLHRLVSALQAEPFDPTCGYRVGADLVGACMSSPEVLGESITLLSHQLLPAVGATHDVGSSARLAALMGELAIGFTEELRDLAMVAAESINRAEKAAWRREQQELQRQLQYALLHDPLTGLPNRSMLLDWIAGQIRDAGDGDRLGVCLLHLDQLSTVNDSLGHDKGDRLLRALSHHLRPVATRHGYLLAHLGGDEFALGVAHTIGPEDMLKAVDQVMRAVPDPFDIDGHRLPITARAGIVERASAGADPTELLRAGRIALGWARTDHHSPYAIFDSRRSDADIRRHELTAAMPAALRNEEFVLVYQPLIRLADRRVVGVEALARWNHPTLGLLGPDQFIPLAEQTGLIGPLGLYLLGRACAQGAAWQHQVDQPMMSVNLAALQLACSGLAAALAAELDRAQLPPARLQLEITESTVLDTHHSTLHQLADLGVRLAIDDFGTGYSSLAYLAEIPVFSVKLAARFLHGLGDGDPDRDGPDRDGPDRDGPDRDGPDRDGPDSGGGSGGGRDSSSRRGRTATILPSLINMCHDLGICVIAEGIETESQARRLTELHCDIGQGYYLGRPATAERITQLLSRRPAVTG